MSAVNEPRETPPPLVPEVLPPDLPVPPPRSDASRGQVDGKAGIAFHPLSALLLVIVDTMWLIPEFSGLWMIISIPLSFLMVFTGTFLIQRTKLGDSVGWALLKAVFLGVLAAVPFSITGTPVGLALLAWAGIKHPWRS